MVAFNNRIYVPWHAKSEAAPRACGGLLKVCGGKDDNDAEDCTCWGLVTKSATHRNSGHCECQVLGWWLWVKQGIGVAGGCWSWWTCFSCEELSSVEGFDPATGCWEVLPSMNTRRANAGVVASEGVKAAYDNFDWAVLMLDLET